MATYILVSTSLRSGVAQWVEHLTRNQSVMSLNSIKAPVVSVSNKLHYLVPLGSRKGFERFYNQAKIKCWIGIHVIQ